MKLSCPSCGSELEFRYDDSFVRVCGACRSAIVRTDRGLDTFGQFADVAPSASGLELGQRGRYGGQPFVIAGRVAYAHPSGGSWEELFLKLSDGRWAWLSHAQGQLAMTFESASERVLPPFEALEPGARVELGGEEGAALVVGERNTGTLTAAEGELPFMAVPGSVSRFADLSDAKGRFATIDYGPAGTREPLRVYLGRRVTAGELGLSVRAAQATQATAWAQRAGERLACPNCGGSIELRAPGRSLSVACPYCASILDCEGPLTVLQKVEQASERKPPIPLGAQGTFDGVTYTVTGRLRREATYAEAFIAWDEYLLYSPEAGYRWLACANGHYSFVTELPPGAVEVGPYDAVTYEGHRFALYDAAEPRVAEVYGEFYWKVHVGEQVKTRDYIAPPAMLSRESSESELHWSLGLYQTPEDVRRAFEMPHLVDERRGVAGNEPFRHQHWGRVSKLLFLTFFLIAIAFAVSAGERSVYSGRFSLTASNVEEPAGRAPSPYVSRIFFTPKFELSSGDNVRVKLELPLSNSWAGVLADLIHEESGELRSFDLELSYYSGVEGGESWSEGSTRASKLLSAAKGGTHSMRLEVQTPTRMSQSLSVTVEQDVFVWSHFLWVLFVLGLPSAVFAIWQYSFERERWSESDFAPAHYTAGAGGGDD